MKIRKDSLVEWGLDENEVYENALLNTYLLTPPRIYQWERLVLNPDYDGAVSYTHLDVYKRQ